MVCRALRARGSFASGATHNAQDSSQLFATTINVSFTTDVMNRLTAAAPPSEKVRGVYGKSPQREVVRSSAGAGAVYPPPHFFGVRVAYPKTWYQTSNPLQNHHFGTENDHPMNFSILTPLALPPVPRYPIFGGWVWVGVGGGSKLLCILWPLCVDLDPGPLLPVRCPVRP